MNTFKKDMGCRLAAHRKNILHLTQEQAAELLDISLKHYSEIERGITGVSIDGLIAISTKLGINIDYLLTGNNQYIGIPSELLDCYNSLTEDKKSKILEIIKLLTTF